MNITYAILPNFIINNFLLIAPWVLDKLNLDDFTFLAHILELTVS